MAEATDLNQSVPARQRFYSLDLLKFILAIIIVFHHFQQVLGVRFDRLNFYYGRIYFGYAVEFFFIISGFVIAFQTELKGFGSFRSWMMAKISRILPMAALSVLACMGVDLLSIAVNGVNAMNGIKMKGLGNLATSLTCTFVGGGVLLNDLGVNNPLWYVSVLFICYAVLYCLNRFSPRIGISAHYLYIGMALLGLGIHYYNINLPFLNGQVSRGYVAFFLGMLIYEIYKRYGSNRRLYIFSIVMILICFSSAALKMIDDQWAIFTFLLFPSVLFLFVGVEKVLSANVFAVLGGVSFEMYLWHFPFLCLYKLVRKMFGITMAVTHLEMVCFTLSLIVICMPVTLILEKKIRRAIIERGFENCRCR